MILSRYLKLIGLTFNLLTDFNEMIYVEVRDRLGIANIYVSCDINGTAQLETANSIQSQSELHLNGNLFTLNLIDVNNGSVKKLGVRWPIDIKLSNSNNVIYKPIYNTGDLIFRISLNNSDGKCLNNASLSILSQKSVLSDVSSQRKSFLPACLPDEQFHEKSQSKEIANLQNESLKAFCGKCGKNLFSFNCFRMLPLPSINWKESTNEWFCGCSHFHKSVSQDAKKCDKAQDLHNCGELTNSKNQTNRQLAKADLSPSLGDILYSKAFVCINEETLVKEGLQNVSNHASALYCSECNSELGYKEGIIAKDILTFWGHSINIECNTTMPRKTERDPMTTVITLIDLLLEESGKPFTQIILKKMGEKSSVLVRILEPNLRLLMPEYIENDVYVLAEKQAMKVLFTCSNDSIATMESSLDVTSVVIGSNMFEVLVGKLNDNLKMIPISQRFQKGHVENEFTFSYILKDA